MHLWHPPGYGLVIVSIQATVTHSAKLLPIAKTGRGSCILDVVCDDDSHYICNGSCLCDMLLKKKNRKALFNVGSKLKVGGRAGRGWETY